MVDPLQHELSIHEWCRMKLKEEFPDVDEQTLADTLEGMTNLPEMLASVMRSQLDDMALIAALKSRLSDMQDRLSRIGDRAQKKRDLVTAVMERAGIKKLSEPEFTVSLRPSPRHLVITDENAIPEAYWRPQVPRLDRQALLSQLSSGVEIPGAILGNIQMTISVRTR